MPNPPPPPWLFRQIVKLIAAWAKRRGAPPLSEFDRDDPFHPSAPRRPTPPPLPPTTFPQAPRTREIRFRQTTPVNARTQDNDTLRVELGEITGTITIDNYLDAARGAGEESGFMSLRFVFTAEDGRGYTHTSILRAPTLWPSPTTRVAPMAGTFDAACVFKMLVDTRGKPPALHVSGTPWNSEEKLNDLLFAVRCEETHLAVRLRYYVGSVTPRAPYEAVEYAVPYEHILWRRAPILHADDIGHEGQPLVEVRPMSEQGTAPTRPSPIRIC